MPADNISKTISQYKDFSQLQLFAEAQQTTIVQLSKKLQKIEDERDHLKSLLESSVPLMKTEETKELEKLHGNNTESICHNEIRKLKEVSSVRELTYEEAKRLDIYFKILNQVSNMQKPPLDAKVKDMNDKDLLKLVESDDGTGK